MKHLDESLIGQCETILSKPLETNLLGMKLATDVTLLFLSVADNDIFVYFFMSQLWTMKLTESMNTCHFSDIFALTINVNIKEMENYRFLKILI